MSNTSEADLDLYINAALGKKAIDLVVLDVHDLTHIHYLQRTIQPPGQCDCGAYPEKFKKAQKKAFKCRRCQGWSVGPAGLRPYYHPRIL
jgi:hypothetical protein